MKSDLLAILKNFSSVVVNIIFAVMLLAGLSLILLTIFRYKVFAVYTPSMQETYPVGSVVIVDHTLAEDIKPGDAISFVANEDYLVVTHRVVEKHENAAEPYFITQGDSNNSADSGRVYFKNLIGRVVLCIPYLGYLFFLVNKIEYKILLVVVLIVVIVSANVLIIKQVKKRKL